MSDQKRAVVFIHGLNTYKVDHLRIGPLDLGPMDQHLQKFFETFTRYFALTDFYADTLHEQIKKCEHQLRALIQAEQLKAVVLVSHSAGGLIARALAHHLADFSVRFKVVCIATPHHGVEGLNERLAVVAQKKGQRLLKGLGYSVSERTRLLSEFDSEKMVSFNRLYPPLNGVEYFNFICGVETRLLPLAYRVVQKFLGLSCEPSDGVVTVRSQRFVFKSVLGASGVGGCASEGGSIKIESVYKISHLSQLGFFVKGFSHSHERSEFERLMNDVKRAINS